MTSSLTHSATDATVRPLLKTGREGCKARFDSALYQLVQHYPDRIEKIDLGFSGSRVLERLLQTPGEVVSREELLRHAWENRVVGQGSLNQQIYTLRQLLFDSGNQIIQTLPRRGYLFNPNYLAAGHEAAIVHQPIDPVPAPAEATSVPPAQPITSSPSRRWSWPSPLLAGTTLMTLIAVAALGYRFLLAPKGPFTHTQGVGALQVLYVDKSQRLLDALVMETRELVATIAAMNIKPTQLIVNMSPGFYEIRCVHSNGQINWLKVHKSRLNAIPNQQLQGCLQ
ncbi:winged helix-turn-helix domain-containing protein [Stutzerimonas stutzeri]|uniref:transcriptional regulator n=1 Tax=Stutzerimonas sp. S1 TaxID=3030652 RepID=UPI0022251F09|nr:winged helix-turn-helix domain-containing protein [Stutzerimonas sp. S1]MCW3150580.1 winged helix-turn-helix domain-containing protein [Stutzerimonas sp. S1]